MSKEAPAFRRGEGVTFEDRLGQVHLGMTGKEDPETDRIFNAVESKYGIVGIYAVEYYLKLDLERLKKKGRSSRRARSR